MIGADDVATFFDPDEFGVEVTIAEPGLEPRPVSGMWGEPGKPESLRRLNTNGAGGLRVGPGSSALQLFNSDAPANRREAKLTVDGVEYSIADHKPLGRLRTLFVLVPYGDRNARQGQTDGRWLPPRS